MTHLFDCGVCGTSLQLPDDETRSRVELACWSCGAVMEVHRFRMEVIQVLEHPSDD